MKRIPEATLKFIFFCSLPSPHSTSHVARVMCRRKKKQKWTEVAFLHSSYNPPPLVVCMVVRQLSEVPRARAAGITHLSPRIA